MEGDNFSTIQKENMSTSVTTAPELLSFPKISFIPDDLGKLEDGPFGVREKCAYAGLVVAGISVLSWVVIILGILFSVIGAALSIVGLKSRRSKHARVGLVMAVIGLIASIGYAFAVYQGRVNYNYFTSEFLGTSSNVVEATQ